MGRRKIEITEVKDPNTKQVTFSKRRTGLFKKANELSILCGAEVAIVVFSPGDKPYSFGHPSVDAVANKFLNPNGTPSNAVAVVDEEHVNGLNLHLSDVQTEVLDEQKRTVELEKMLQQNGVKLSPDVELKGSFLQVHQKVQDFFGEIDVANYMLLLAKAPVVGITEQVPPTKKRRIK